MINNVLKFYIIIWDFSLNVDEELSSWFISCNTICLDPLINFNGTFYELYITGDHVNIVLLNTFKLITTVGHTNSSIEIDSEFLKVKFTIMQAMNAYRALDVWIHPFLTSALDGSKWPASRPNRFFPGEETPVPTEWEAVWAPGPVRIFFAYAGIHNPDHPSSTRVTRPGVLPQLLGVVKLCIKI